MRKADTAAGCSGSGPFSLRLQAETPHSHSSSSEVDRPVCCVYNAENVALCLVL